jgi:5S rRNA maturation endonuclease (ribonuclease M5)
MIITESLESLIRRHVILGKKSRKGYEVVKCACCNDYKVRGGFKFEGDSVHYQCFNCSVSEGYSPSSGFVGISDKFKKVLLDFCIPLEEIQRCVNANYFKKNELTKGKTDKKIISVPRVEAPFPDGSVLVSSKANEWCELAESYLNSRCISSKDYNFYVSNDSVYCGRVIIPYFFREKVIFWQARSLDDKLISPRYLNPHVDKDNVFFNMDELYRNTTEPLIVTEGPLDAISIGRNAVALTGSVLSEFKLNELKKVAARRKVIFVLDKNLNGKKLGLKVLEESTDKHKFYITVLPDNIDDSNDALKQLGRLWLIAHITSTAITGFSAKVTVELKCK